MRPTTEIQHAAQRGHRRLLNGMLPLAACLALAVAPAAYAQSVNQSVACSGAQKTEGEGGSMSTWAQPQKTEGEGGSASTWAQQQKAGAIPCKG